MTTARTSANRSPPRVSTLAPRESVTTIAHITGISDPRVARQRFRSAWARAAVTGMPHSGQATESGNERRSYPQRKQLNVDMGDSLAGRSHGQEARAVPHGLQSLEREEWPRRNLRAPG